MQAAPSSFDAVIVGAGSVGMAAGWYLSRAGRKVLLLDPADPPHAQGSHHGATRLIRHAYGEGAAYVPLALRAQELWHDLERQADEQLFERTGVLNAAPAGHRFIAEVQRSADEYRLELQVMEGSEANRRWPAWRLPQGHAVCFEPGAGVLYCEKAVAAFRRLALAAGATLHANAAVARIEGTTVTTAGGESFTGKEIIVCAGKSTKSLVEPLGLRLPVKRVRKTFAWFASDAKFSSRAFPGFAVLTDLGLHYGFPDLEGRGLKVGRHDGGEAVTAETPLAPFGPADREDIEAFLRAYLPGSGQLRLGVACEYDMSPDEHFIVDRVPGHPRLQVATGFSGHGFKFASAIGEALAQRVIAGESRMDLSLFSCTRFAH